jgi:hypothetical protein
VWHDPKMATDPGPDQAHQLPPDLDRPTVEALGKLSEALESTERARGHLYAFHQLTGKSDTEAGDAVELLRQAGHSGLADRIATELVGRNVLAGRWTFQVVEEYDDGYWATFRELERAAREQLAGGRRHLYEASMKEARRSHGRSGHEAKPGDPGD